MLILNKALLATHFGQSSTRYAGFGLLEALIAVAILAIMVSIALPSFSNFISQEKARTQVEEYAKTVSVARSAAIKSGVPVIICSSDNPSSCSGDWADGWLVYEDDDRDGVLDTGEPVLLRYSNSDAALDTTVSSPNGTALSSISFNHRGSPSVAHSISATRDDKSASVSITPFGKARIHD